MRAVSKFPWGIPALAAGIFALADAPALADENGVMTSTTYPCTDNALTTIVEVCKKVQTFFPGVECPKQSATCVRARQEIFTGLTGETASPGNIKSWNGQGVSGQIFQGVGLCLMRDLAASPMTSAATASLPAGTIKAEGLVDYRSFDPATGVFRGVHRLTAHAPAIGKIDIMTQEFTARPVNSTLTGKGLTVGAYAATGAHALDFEADGGAEEFKFELDAMTISTPYGTVTPKPRIILKRGSFWSLSPYGGSTGMTLNPGGFRIKDVYGRSPGQAVASGVKTWETKAGKYPGAKRCMDFGRAPLCVWPAPAGWDSQVTLGARNVDPGPGGAAWTAPAGDAFPFRPDADATKARSQLEKIPNGYAEAGIKIEYDLLGLLPDAIKNSGYIKPTASMFVDPNVAVGYASQFNFWNAQASVWDPALDPGAPAPFATPTDTVSLHSAAIYGGAGVAGRFAFDVGVDLTLKVFIPLPWPLDDISFTLLDQHPRAAFLETVDASSAPSAQSARAVADSQHFAATGSMFSAYKTLSGANVDGVQHLAQCFAEPAPPEKTPPAITYEPGDPKDLIENLEMPCNICIGHAEFPYLDVKSQSPLTFALKKLPAVAQKIQPVSDAALPASEKWVCGGPLPEGATIAYVPQAIDPAKVKTADEAKAFNKASQEKASKGFKNAGCYDRCRLNAASGKFELIQSAKSLYAAGIIKDAPNGCY